MTFIFEGQPPRKKAGIPINHFPWIQAGAMLPLDPWKHPSEVATCNVGFLEQKFQGSGSDPPLPLWEAPTNNKKKPKRISKKYSLLTNIAPWKWMELMVDQLTNI